MIERSLLVLVLSSSSSRAYTFSLTVYLFSVLVCQFAAQALAARCFQFML